MKARQLAEFYKTSVPAVMEMINSNDKQTRATARRYIDMMDIIQDASAQHQREARR